MESRDRSFTLIIAPNATSRVKQFQISLRRVYAAIFILILVTLLTAGGVIRYLIAMKKLSGYESVLSQHINLQEQNLDLSEQTRQLAEKVAHIEMVAKNITRLTGISLDGPQSTTGGVGGSSPNQWLKNDLRADNLKFVRDLNAKTSQVETQVIRLKDVVLEQSLFLSSLPTSWPVRGYIGSSFGRRPDPMNGSPEFHEGIDISAAYGAKVSAPADGVVLFAGAQRGYGYVVVLAHKYGISTRFGHLSTYSVRPGQHLRKNDILGYVGSTGKATGPHLHFEVRIDNNPVNPVRFLGSTASL